MRTFAERLKFAMDSAEPEKIKNVDLAKAIGVKPPSVSEYLSGKIKSMNGEKLVKASKYLHVTSDWLATGKGEMHPAQVQHHSSQSQSQSMGGQGQSLTSSGLLAKSPRSQALESLINKLDELEQQQVINEEEVSLLRHTVEVLTKSKAASNPTIHTKKSIFKE